MAKKAWKDPRGAHVRLYIDLLDSPAWAVLSTSARVVYAEFRSKLGKTNNGDLSFTMADASRRGAIKSQTTLALALFELRALGFIKVTRKGAVFSGSKLATLYRFTDEPYAEFVKEGGFTFGPGKATFEFFNFKTLEAAQSALSSGVAQLHDEASKQDQNRKKQKKLTLQKMDSNSPDSVLATPVYAPDSVALDPPTSPENEDLLQVRSGVNSLASDTAKGKPSRRVTHAEIHGAYLPRVLCAVDLCPTLNCGARLGEPHNKGCRLEACPSCGSPSWPACKCGLEKGKNFKSLGNVPRTWATKRSAGVAA